MIGIHIVDITNIKNILKNCPYYDEIIDYEFDYSDEITIDLINWYKDFVFMCNINNDEERKLLSKVDKSIYMYTKDHKYRKGLKNIILNSKLCLSGTTNNKKITRKILAFTNKYEYFEVLNINQSKWL